MNYLVKAVWILKKTLLLVAKWEVALLAKVSVRENIRKFALSMDFSRNEVIMQSHFQK